MTPASASSLSTLFNNPAPKNTVPSGKQKALDSFQFKDKCTLKGNPSFLGKREAMLSMYTCAGWSGRVSPYLKI